MSTYFLITPVPLLARTHSLESIQLTHARTVMLRARLAIMLVCKAVLLVLEESILMLFLLLMALVLTVIMLAQPALEELILNARSVTLQFLL
jgi:hypothetical protein